MQFNSRINLISSCGRWLGKISAEKASDYLARRSAVVDHVKGDRVRGVRLVERAMPIKGPTPLTIASYMGQRYVGNEAVKSESGDTVARCYKLKDIHEDDQPIFRQTIADVYKARQ